MSLLLKPGVNPGLSNAEYHAEKTHLSSSNLKLLLQSPAQFHKEKILGQREPMSGSALDVGSYTHSLILEPEKVAEEFAIYKQQTRQFVPVGQAAKGLRKQGPEFDAFKLANAGKIILSENEAQIGQRLANAVQGSPPALELLKGGMPELSLASSIFDVPVKMRADYINPDAGYIVDVKTTRWPSDVDTFRRVVRELGYELSAALYCDIAYRVYGKLFDFYWVVLSKNDWDCQVYKASMHTLSEGSALVIKSVVAYKKCLAANHWPDTLDGMQSTTNTEHEVLEV